MSDNRPRKPSQKTGKRADKRFPDQNDSSLTRMIRTFGNKIPLDLPSPGTRIVVFFGIVLMALLALFVIGAIIANVTGYYDNIPDIVTGEIVIAGIGIIAGVILTRKKNVQ